MSAALDFVRLAAIKLGLPRKIAGPWHARAHRGRELQLRAWVDEGGDPLCDLSGEVLLYAGAATLSRVELEEAVSEQGWWAAYDLAADLGRGRA